MTPSISITTRMRKRTDKTGAMVLQRRHVINYRDPVGKRRRQEFFERKKDAQARRNELILQFGNGTYVPEKSVPTISVATAHWLKDKATRVKPNTLASCEVVLAHILRPLGPLKIPDLSTARIREWHREISERTGSYTGKRAKAYLKAILALAEEDYRGSGAVDAVGLGPRPRQGRRRRSSARLQIAGILEAARHDPEHGIYYAFPFLAGTRPSEQLGLLWKDVDFERNVIRSAASRSATAR